MLDVWLAALLDSSLKGLALCLAAGAAALLLRRSSAAARHLVWRLAFAGLLALPVLATLLPAWRVPLPGLEKAARVAAALPAALSVPAVAAVEPAPAREGTSPSPTFRFEEVGAEPRGWDLSWQAVAFGIWLLGASRCSGRSGSLFSACGGRGGARGRSRIRRGRGSSARSAPSSGVGRPVALIAGERPGDADDLGLAPARGSAAGRSRGTGPSRGGGRCFSMSSPTSPGGITRRRSPPRWSAPSTGSTPWSGWRPASCGSRASTPATTGCSRPAPGPPTMPATCWTSPARSVLAGSPRRPASPWPAPRSSRAGSSRCSTLIATAGASRAASPSLPGWSPICVVLPLAALAPAAAERATQASPSARVSAPAAPVSSAPQAVATTAQAGALRPRRPGLPRLPARPRRLPAPAIPTR